MFDQTPRKRKGSSIIKKKKKITLDSLEKYTVLEFLCRYGNVKISFRKVSVDQYLRRDTSCRNFD